MIVIVAGISALLAAVLPGASQVRAAVAVAAVMLLSAAVRRCRAALRAIAYRGRLRRALRPLAGARPDDSFVYLIGTESGEGLVKIGRSVNVRARLANLQTGSPVRLTVLWVTPGGHALETRLHRTFASSRVHGEWFALGPAAVEAVRAALPKAEVAL